MGEVHDTKHLETLGEYYPRMSTEVQTQNRPFKGFKAQNSAYAITYPFTNHIKYDHGGSGRNALSRSTPN